MHNIERQNHKTVQARMHFTGPYWFRLSFMGGFASKYFPVELDMM